MFGLGLRLIIGFIKSLPMLRSFLAGVIRIRYPWFIFPPETNDILVKWFNQPFNDLTEEETKIVWEEVRQHPEIEEISDQIWDELKKCVELETGWHIY